MPSGQLVGDGRESGRLKLIAGLLGVSLDMLIHRERKRQRQLVAALAASALTFASRCWGSSLGFEAQRSNDLAQAQTRGLLEGQSRTIVEAVSRRLEQERERRTMGWSGRSLSLSNPGSRPLP